MKLKQIITLEKNTTGKFVTHRYFLFYSHGGDVNIIGEPAAIDLAGLLSIPITVVDTRGGRAEGRAERFEDLPIKVKKN